MAAISGSTGGVTFANGYADNTYSWQVTGAQEALETTEFNPTSGYRTFTPGLRGWTGSYEAYVDDSTALPAPDDTGDVTLTASSGKTYTGSIIVTSYDVRVSVDGANRVCTCSFTGTGVLTGA